MTGITVRGALAGFLAALAVLGALPVSMLAARVLTPLVTGWRKHPGLVQGCESSVHCAQMEAFLVVWGLSLLVYALLCARAYRRMVRRAAERTPAPREDLLAPPDTAV